MKKIDRIEMLVTKVSYNQLFATLAKCCAEKHLRIKHAKYVLRNNR